MVEIHSRNDDLNGSSKSAVQGSAVGTSMSTRLWYQVPNRGIIQLTARIVRRIEMRMRGS